MIRTFGKMTMLALALSSYTFTHRVRQGDSTTIENPDSTGTVSFALQLAGGAHINTANYHITGPNGFTKTGTINVSSRTRSPRPSAASPRARASRSRIPATTTDGTTSCGGSADFNVTAGQTVSVAGAAGLPRGAAHRQRRRSTARSTSARRSTASAPTRPRPTSAAPSPSSAAAHDSDAGAAGARLRLDRRAAARSATPTRANPTLHLQHAGHGDRHRDGQRRRPRLRLRDDADRADQLHGRGPHARHVRRRRLPQPHHLLGRLHLDAEAGQEGDRQASRRPGASTGSCRPATAATATATAAGRRRDARHAGLSVRRRAQRPRPPPGRTPA